MTEILRFLKQGRLSQDEGMEITSNESDVTRGEGQDASMLKI